MTNRIYLILMVWSMASFGALSLLYSRFPFAVVLPSNYHLDGYIYSNPHPLALRLPFWRPGKLTDPTNLGDRARESILSEAAVPPPYQPFLISSCSLAVCRPHPSPNWHSKSSRARTGRPECWLSDQSPSPCSQQLPELKGRWLIWKLHIIWFFSNTSVRQGNSAAFRMRSKCMTHCSYVRFLVTSFR